MQNTKPILLFSKILMKSYLCAFRSFLFYFFYSHDDRSFINLKKPDRAPLITFVTDETKSKTKYNMKF